MHVIFERITAIEQQHRTDELANISKLAKEDARLKGRIESGILDIQSTLQGIGHTQQDRIMSILASMNCLIRQIERLAPRVAAASVTVGVSSIAMGTSSLARAIEAHQPTPRSAQPSSSRPPFRTYTRFGVGFSSQTIGLSSKTWNQRLGASPVGLVPQSFQSYHLMMSRVRSLEFVYFIYYLQFIYVLILYVVCVMYHFLSKLNLIYIFLSLYLNLFCHD